MTYSFNFFPSFLVGCFQIHHLPQQYRGIFVTTVMIFFVNTLRILEATVIFFFESFFESSIATVILWKI